MTNDPASDVILIIDDLKEIRQFLKQRLDDFGYHVSEAESGTEGLAMAKDLHPQVILMDYEMPGLNGLETCRALKEEPSTKNIPIIILSSYPFGKNQIDAMNDLGIAAYLMKPYEFDDLLIKLNQLLNQQHSTFFEPNEKRGTKRFKAGYTAQIEIDGAKFPAKLVNVSREGICLLIPQKEKVGTKLKIYFENPEVLTPHIGSLESRSNPVGTAKMIWISSKQQNGMYLTGLEMQTI